MKKVMRSIVVLLSCLLPVLAMAQNAPPVATASGPGEMLTSTTERLSGSATDSDGDAIAGWRWTVTSSPTGSQYDYDLDSILQNPRFIPHEHGDYVLTLEASDGTDWSEPAYLHITSRQVTDPIALIADMPTTVVVGEPVYFDGSASSVDPLLSDQAIMYDWNFGTGESAYDPSPSYVFMDAGVFTVQLRVQDSLFQTDVDQIEITVVQPGNRPPEITSMTANPVSGQPPLDVMFSATATDVDGDAIDFAWDFDDAVSGPDNTSTLAAPSHRFITAGTYNVLLTVSDGLEDVSRSLTISVDSPYVFSTRAATVDTWGNGNANKARVMLDADMNFPPPAADDRLRLTFDGQKVFDVKFGQFESENPGVYTLTTRWSFVRIDFASGRLHAEHGKLNDKKINQADDIVVELLWGNDTAADQFRMTQEDADSWTYSRP